MAPARFEIADCPSEQVARLRGELAVSGALAQVLVRRGLSDPTEARAFLAAEEEHPPSAFAGIEQAVATILAHVSASARITIHGDYDVDGICSTAILVRALRSLGADVDSYLPDRIGDGYGLATATVRRLAERGTRLLVTVDCAVTAVEEVALAHELGMQVVVTDHHAPRADGQLPRAPLVHPALCGYPCPQLCATAVAFKLAQALFAAAGRDPRELEPELELVALATVADVVALTGENRTLVRRGLRALARTRRPGLRALMAVARVAPGRLDERALGFALAPRLNAAGRMYRADAGLELLLTEDRLRAQQVAEELDRANYERREAELRIRHEAEAQVAELGERSAYVLAGERWHPGVIGIVASRLAEAHHRPVVLIALDGASGKGSARSIPGFDLLAGLTACSAHLLRYGGHRAAAGLEIERERVAALALALDEHAELALGGDDLGPVERVDAIVGGEELGMGLAEELARLAPFGHGNPGVSLMLADACLRDARPMGEGKHVRFTVESRGARAQAVGFRTGGGLPVQEGVAVEATFRLEVNEWNGVQEPRLVLRQARAAEPRVLRREMAAEPRIEARSLRERRAHAQRPTSSELPPASERPTEAERPAEPAPPAEGANGQLALC
jgi:single-stranded-DNA-specific exonuclease